MSSRSSCRPQLLYTTLLTQCETEADCGGVGVREDMTSSAQAELLEAVERQDLEALTTLLAADDTDLVNAVIEPEQGNTALHVAARRGYVAVAQTLCAFGCQLELHNSGGVTPLHLASRRGHTELVRCLCLAGSRVDHKSATGVLPEVMAMAKGHDDITDLLTTLRNTSYRDEYIGQLVPSTAPIPCIKLKLLGFSGAGKTELRRCLSASVLSSLLTLRLSGHPQQEGKGDAPHKSLDEMELSPSSPPTSLSCEPQENFTQGIDVQHVNMSGCGRFSIWEFSGHPCYYPVYDHFLGSSACAHLLVFPLDAPCAVQLQHCLYWLAFLRARMAPQEPLGLQGRPHRPARVGLVGTRADLAHCPRTPTGEYLAPHTNSLISKVRAAYGCVFEIHHEVFVLDATAAAGQAVRNIRQYLADVKAAVTKTAPSVTGFLRQAERVCTELLQETQDFPILSWEEFVDALHKRANPLAGEDHLREVVQQLQLQGQLVYLAAGAQDLLVLQPAWLTQVQLGNLMNPKSKLRSRITGCFTVDDFQMRYPYCDALELMTVLEALCLCTQCDNDGDIEYEFPTFNQVETLDGLWDKSDPRYRGAVYAGVRLRTQHDDMKLLAPIYPRIQVQLRRCWQQYPEHDSDLYQWCGGSKFCCGPLEAVLSLEQCGEAVEVKVRGPSEATHATFFFLEDLLAMVDQVLLEMCPGLVVHKYILSSRQLASVSSSLVHAWPPSEVFGGALLGGSEATLSNPFSGEEETFSTLVWLDDPRVSQVMVLGPDVSVSRLSTLAVQQLSALMDPVHPRGADWCVLAVRLGLQPQLPQLEVTGEGGGSPTVALLGLWREKEGEAATVGALITQLREMEREDASYVLMSCAPLYHLSPSQHHYNNLQRSLSQVITVSGTSPLPSSSPSNCDGKMGSFVSTRPGVMTHSFSQEFARGISQEFGDRGGGTLRGATSSTTEAAGDYAALSTSLACKKDASALVVAVSSLMSAATNSSGYSLSTQSTPRSDSSNGAILVTQADEESVLKNVEKEPLFSSDEQVSPSKELSPHDSTLKASLGTANGAEKSVSLALFTLDESSQSPTAFSSIPSTYNKSSPSSDILSPTVTRSELEAAGTNNVMVHHNSPDITTSCTPALNGQMSLYVLPDVASSVNVSVAVAATEMTDVKKVTNALDTSRKTVEDENQC